MKVTVMTPARNKIPLEGVETLQDVKHQVMERTGIPVRKQLIYFRGRLLKSLRRPLSAYSVREDSTLYLVKKLRVCRCLACRNSRYLEREEVAEEQELLRELLGYSQEVHNAESEVRATAETERLEEEGMTDVALEGVGFDRDEIEVSEETPEVWEDAVEEQDALDVENAQSVISGGEVIPGDDAEEAVAEVEEMEGCDDAEEIRNTENTAENEVETEETEEEPRDHDEFEGVGESEVIDLDDDAHDLEAEDADDEEEPEEEDAGEEPDLVEDIEEEPILDNDEEEEAHETQDDDDENNILYSLAPADTRTSRQQQTDRPGGPAEDNDEEPEDGDSPPAFRRQAAFEEDGTNSVGEENPDIADAEDDADEAVGADPDPLPSDEDILLAMTRPSRLPEEDADPLEEDPYALAAELEDPLFEPPDEEDPGYVSGDERDE